MLDAWYEGLHVIELCFLDLFLNKYVAALDNKELSNGFVGTKYIIVDRLFTRN